MLTREGAAGVAVAGATTGTGIGKGAGTEATTGGGVGTCRGATGAGVAGATWLLPTKATFPATRSSVVAAVREGSGTCGGHDPDLRETGGASRRFAAEILERDQILLSRPEGSAPGAMDRLAEGDEVGAGFGGPLRSGVGSRGECGIVVGCPVTPDRCGGDGTVARRGSEERSRGAEESVS